MQKFNIFSVILASVLVVVVAEYALNDYGQSASDRSGEVTFNLPNSLDLSKATETSVLSFDEIPFSDGVIEEEPVAEEVESESRLPDFEDESFATELREVNLNVSSVYLRDEQVQSAGFVNAFVLEEPHEGLLFKSVYLDDLYDMTTTKWAVQTDTQLFAKVYAFTFGPDSGSSEVYEVLKIRASQGLNAEVNETDGFGDASFYMNDSRRQNTAFLVTRLGSVVYAFSYPKEYHQQITNLITLLDLEF